jgi:D-amino peptidase
MLRARLEKQNAKFSGDSVKRRTLDTPDAAPSRGIDKLFVKTVCLIYQANHNSGMTVKKFAVRSDMEGLYGVVSWSEVIPGTATYEGARRWLHEELTALVSGLADGGADGVEIYDEHYYGLNIDPALLPRQASVIRGKPPYRKDWPGGLDATVSGLVLQGYHAMTGVRDGILSHTYEPDIRAIHINGTLVGEIGVEAAIAGEAGVPLTLYIGDRHGAEEASALIPGVATVVVKDGMGLQCGRCRNGAAVRQEIHDAARRVAQDGTTARPLLFGADIKLTVSLFAGPYRDCLRQNTTVRWQDDETVLLRADSVTAAWADYWNIKDETLAKLKK